MKLPLKKAVRSLQVMIPNLQEIRFTVHRKALQLSGRPWRPDVEALRYFDPEEPVILDVGANRGLSVSSILMMKPRAKVIAFEPLVRLATTLERRYQGLSNVTVHSCALGSTQRQMTIFIPVYRGYVFDPLASLDRHEATNWVNSERFFFFNPEKLRIEEQRVNVCRLEDFSLEPDVIKIYAQGHEPSIIQGGEATILRYQPAILAPARIPKIDECLRRLGYTRYAFRSSAFWREGEGHTSSWYLKPKHVEMFRCSIKRG